WRPAAVGASDGADLPGRRGVCGQAPTGSAHPRGATPTDPGPAPVVTHALCGRAASGSGHSRGVSAVWVSAGRDRHTPGGPLCDREPMAEAGRAGRCMIARPEVAPKKQTGGLRVTLLPFEVFRTPIAQRLVQTPAV